MTSGKLREVEGEIISISDYLKNEGKKTIPKTKIKTLEKELSKPHLVYDNIALTDNYIIAMNAGGSPNGAFTSIKYDDLVWIYTGETGGFASTNVIRVMSLADGGEEKNAKTMAKASVATDMMKGLVDILMVGVPTGGNQSVLIAFSKDRTAIVASDARSRMFTTKSSKNFRELLATIIDRGPSDLMVGDQYEDAFCEMMGIDTYRTDNSFGVPPDEYGDGDGGDDLL